MGVKGVRVLVDEESGVGLGGPNPELRLRLHLFRRLGYGCEQATVAVDPGQASIGLVVECSGVILYHRTLREPSGVGEVVRALLEAGVSRILVKVGSSGASTLPLGELEGRGVEVIYVDEMAASSAIVRYIKAAGRMSKHELSALRILLTRARGGR